VLNNVVEHAYAEHGRGVVEVEVELTSAALLFRVRDDGRPMPEGEAPAGEARDLEVGTDDLPEGGFGWFLIRELTEGLCYRRIGNRNELTFRIARDAQV
jgi:serine/threonine-protein kinase RsbW